MRAAITSRAEQILWNVIGGFVYQALVSGGVALILGLALQTFVEYPAVVGAATAVIALLVFGGLQRLATWRRGKGTKALVLSTPPLPAPRVFVPDYVTVEYLLGLYTNHTDIQADALLKPYIGKWMRASGHIDSVGSGQVTFKEGKRAAPSLFMYFDKSWLDRLAMLVPGSRATVIGRIWYIQRVWVNLQECELETVGIEEPAPSPTDAERVFVADNVTPAYLLSLGGTSMTVQRQSLREPFMGKWIRVSGTVSDMQVLSSDLSMVYLGTNPRTCLTFAAAWRERVTGLIAGSSVHAIGRIDHIADVFNSVTLVDCELENLTTPDVNELFVRHRVRPDHRLERVAA